MKSFLIIVLIFLSFSAFSQKTITLDEIGVQLASTFNSYDASKLYPYFLSFEELENYFGKSEDTIFIRKVLNRHRNRFKENLNEAIKKFDINIINNKKFKYQNFVFEIPLQKTEKRKSADISIYLIYDTSIIYVKANCININGLWKIYQFEEGNFIHLLEKNELERYNIWSKEYAQYFIDSLPKDIQKKLWGFIRKHKKSINNNIVLKPNNYKDALFNAKNISIPDSISMLMWEIPTNFKNFKKLVIKSDLEVINEVRVNNNSESYLKQNKVAKSIWHFLFEDGNFYFDSEFILTQEEYSQYFSIAYPEYSYIDRKFLYANYLCRIKNSLNDLYNNTILRNMNLNSFNFNGRINNDYFEDNQSTTKYLRVRLMFDFKPYLKPKEFANWVEFYFIFSKETKTMKIFDIGGIY